MSPEEFGQRIKQKYPEYNDIPNGVLAQKILAKYPEYQDMISSAMAPSSIAGPETGAGLTSPAPVSAQPSIYSDPRAPSRVGPFPPEAELRDTFNRLASGGSTEQFAKVRKELIKRGYPPEMVRTAKSLFDLTTKEQIEFANELFGKLAEPSGMKAVGNLMYAPIKYGLEQPLSKAATEGRHKTFEGWLKEAGWSKWPAAGIGLATRMLTIGMFYEAIGGLLNDPFYRADIGKQKINELQNALNSKDYSAVAKQIKEDPVLVRKFFNVDTTSKVMSKIKEQDPEGYKQLFGIVQDMTRGVNQQPSQYAAITPEPLSPTQNIVPIKAPIQSPGAIQQIPSEIAALAASQIPPQISPTGPPSPPPTEPLQTPKEPPEDPNPTTKTIDQEYERLKDSWIGEEDWQGAKATVRTGELQDQIRLTTGEKKFGNLSKDTDNAIQLYIDDLAAPVPGDMEKYYDQLPPEKQKRIDSALNLSPEQKAVAEEIMKDTGMVGELSEKEGVIGKKKDIFTARYWDLTPPKNISEKFRKFGTTTGHAKARKFNSIVEGWTKGYELKIEGATNSLSILKNEINKVIGDRKFIGELGKLKTIDGDPLISTKQLPGYERVEHPNFKRWGWKGSIETEAIIENVEKIIEKISKTKTVGGAVAEDLGPIKTMKGIVSDALKARGFSDGEAENILGRLKGDAGENKETIIKEITEKIIEKEQKVKGINVFPFAAKNIFINQKGDILQRQEVYAPKHIAKNLNNMMGTSKLKGIPAVDFITKYNAITKNWILQSTFFHHQAGARSYYLGSSPWQAGETFFDSMKKITPRQAYRSGLEAIKHLGPEVELLIKNGLTINKMQDWEEDILRNDDTIFGKMLDKCEATKGIKDKINALREQHADFLFKKFMPGLKMQAGLIELKRLLKANPDVDPNVLAKEAASLMNDDFGGLHLKRMGRNPTFQHLFRIFALAPDWTESNIRSMVKAFKRGDEGKVYRDFWKRVLGKSILWTVTGNILLHGKDTPKAYKKAWNAGGDTFYRKLSGLKWADVDVTPIYKFMGGTSNKRKYFSLAGHFRDPFKFVLEPIRSAHYKGSVVSGMAFEARTGKDWAGRSFTGIEELFKKGKTVDWKWGGKAINWDTAPSYLIEQFKGTQPVQIQNLLDYWGGQIEGFDAIANSLGINVRTTYK